MLALSVLGSLSYMVIKVTVRSIDMWIIKNPQYPNVHEFLILQQYYVCLLNANFWSRFHPGGSFKDTCVTIKDICIFYNAGQIYKMPMVSLIWERFFEWIKKMVKRSKGRKTKGWAAQHFYLYYYNVHGEQTGRNVCCTGRVMLPLFIYSRKQKDNKLGLFLQVFNNQTHIKQVPTMWYTSD